MAQVKTDTARMMSRRASGRYLLPVGVVILLVLALAVFGLATVSKVSNASPSPSNTDGQPVNVAKDYTQAQTLAATGHCDRAIPLYLRVIKNATTFPFAGAYVGLGNCYQSTAPNAAIVEYNKALQIDPSNFALYITRANTEYNLGMPGQAIQDDLTAMRFATQVPASYESIAQSFGSFADLSDAVKAMDKAIALAPNSPALYEERGQYYLQAKQYTQALADYRTAIKVAPFLTSRASTYSDLADVYNGLGDYNSALSAIASAIRLEPNNAHYRVKSGDIHLGANSYPGAIDRYNQALHIVATGPDAEAAHEGKGDALVALGQPAKAITEYRAAARLASKSDGIIQPRLKGKIKAAQSGQS